MTQNIRRGIRAGREKELREIRGGKRKGGLAVCEQCLVSNRAQRSLRKVAEGLSKISFWTMISLLNESEFPKQQYVAMCFQVG